jgi:hypothetical protein
MMQRVLSRQGPGSVLRRQDLDDWLVEPKHAAINEPQRGSCGDHLRDRGDSEAGFASDRDLVASVGNAAGVLEGRSASGPDQRHAAELVRPDAMIEP